MPGDGDAAKVGVSDLFERSGREIEVCHGACFTAVREDDVDGLSLEVCTDLPAAHGILVGVATIVTRVRVKEETGRGSNVLAVVVSNSASTETSIVKSALARLGTKEEVDGATNDRDGVHLGGWWGWGWGRRSSGGGRGRRLGAGRGGRRWRRGGGLFLLLGGGGLLLGRGGSRGGGGDGGLGLGVWGGGGGGGRGAGPAALAVRAPPGGAV